MDHLKQDDLEMFSLIEQEKVRQETTIDLIASENYAPAATCEAAGSILTNKYAEGTPGKRFYGGCAIVDKIELLAQSRGKELFGAEHINVQPHSGSQANMAVFLAVLNPGDTILGMSLQAGGHLTHGYKANFSGKLFNSVQYSVDRQTELIDYDEVERLAVTYKPKLIIAGASSYSRIIDFERFASIAKKVGAYLMTDIAHVAGLVAAKLYPSPVNYADFVTGTTQKTLRGPRGAFIACKNKYRDVIDKAVMPGMQGGPFMHIIAAKGVCFKQAQEKSFVDYQRHVINNAQIMSQLFMQRGYRIVSKGTDTHLFVIDLSTQGINGKRAEFVLESIGISLSRSCIPFDLEPAWTTSGIRIGTAAITTRGMKEEEIALLVDSIDTVLKKSDDKLILSKIKENISSLCVRFPLY